eukprot:6395387-Alexandrium_andersonii.AAC.1
MSEGAPARLRGGGHLCGPAPGSSASRHVREAEQKSARDAHGTGALGGPVHDHLGRVRLRAQLGERVLLLPSGPRHPARGARG